MKHAIILISLLLSLSGCYRMAKYPYYFYNKEGFDAFKTNSVFELDTTYHLYVRNTYKTDIMNNKMISMNNLDAARKKDLIEVNYLLLSNHWNKAVYLTMRPDKYQYYYAEYGLGDSLINLYEIRSIQFGVISEQSKTEIIFNDKKNKSDTWSLTKSNTGVFVNSIVERDHDIYQNTLNLDEAFGKKVYFEKIKNYRIVFKEPDNIISNDPKFPVYTNKHTLLGNQIVLAREPNPQLMFRFINEKTAEIIYVGFPISRITYLYKTFFENK